MGLDFEEQVELDLVMRGKKGPRLTPEDIDATIKHSYFHIVPGTTLTICVLTLKNGFHVTGESAAASPQNFDPDIGERIAYKNARDKIWALEGYRLKEQMHRMIGD